jgi:dTDP-4-dehydrorhamnose 3,5-epimerase-like enzyme
MKIDKIKPVFSDDRGDIYDILTDESIQHVGLFTIAKNAVRGKHFHKEQKQYTFVKKGCIKVKIKNLLEKNSNVEEMQLKEMDMILFPSYCYHEITGISDSECLVLTSRTRKDNSYEEDTYRVSDIESFKLN